MLSDYISEFKKTCRPAIYIRDWLVEQLDKAREELKKKYNDSDYEKCANDILNLDLADAIINKHGCIVSILQRHFK